MKFTSSTTFGQDDLLNLERRRHEVEERRVEEVVLHGARRDDVEPIPQTGFLGGQVGDLLLDGRGLAGVLGELCLQRRPFGRDLLDFEIQLG